MRTRRVTAIITAPAALALATVLLLPAAAQAAAPTISSISFSAPTTTSATLQAEINPEGKATRYRFEYGPEDCAASACAKAPPSEEPQIGNGTSPVHVEALLEGLTPGTRYHFRLVAHNTEGEPKSPDQLFATYLPTPVFGPCPNDLFRTENPAAALIDYPSAKLPDCRAYEQASPPGKDAGDITGIVPLAKAAADGGAISFLSSSGIPGGVGAQDIPSYLASRVEGAWSTHGMLPPAAEGDGGLVLGWTPDFTEVFTKATRLASPSETELLATPGTGGAPTVIVGPAPGLEPSFAGTTKDGSLLFESPLALTAGAASGRSNVYLWDSASEELSLAGALNDAKAPAKGAFAGPYDWIKGTNSATLNQGGAARGYYTEEEHAISSDGSAVYFTEAGTGKLYLRLNPAEEQSPMSGGECSDPTLACTTLVSASEKADGKGPHGSELGGPRPAAFQAASADGRVAYFTSSEELTEDANTGPEPSELPPPPTIGRSNLEGEEVNGSFMPAHASGIATNSEYIYWADAEAKRDRAGRTGRLEPRTGLHHRPARRRRPDRRRQPHLLGRARADAIGRADRRKEVEQGSSKGHANQRASRWMEATSTGLIRQPMPKATAESAEPSSTVRSRTGLHRVGRARLPAATPAADSGRRRQHLPDIRLSAPTRRQLPPEESSLAGKQDIAVDGSTSTGRGKGPRPPGRARSGAPTSISKK